jgi:hypothetical protein
MTDSGLPHNASPAAGTTPPARPQGMTFGQILDRISWLLRLNIRLYAGLAAVPGTAATVLIGAGMAIFMAILLPQVRAHPNLPPDPRQFMWGMAPMLLGYLALFPVYALYAAAAAHAVVRSNLGEAVTGAQAWSVAWKRGGRHIWLLFLLAAIVAGPFYLIVALLFGFSVLLGFQAHGSQFPAGFFVLFPILVVVMLAGYAYMILAFLRYSLVFATCVIEDLPASAAFKRSAQLTRGARGRIFLVMLVVYAASYAMILVGEIGLFLFAGVGVLIGSLLHLSLQSAGLLFFVIPLAILALLAMMLLVFSLPYACYSAALGVLYCDQRYRVDGALPPPYANAGPA